MVYCFDIDGTVCSDFTEQDIKLSTPNESVIEEINRLYEAENKIILFTARRDTYDNELLTKKQLKQWKVKYHELNFGNKPEYDLLVDSKAINSFTWAKQVELKKKRIGFVASSFDLLHAGHCIMLQDARKQCDHLIAALQSDPTIDRPEKNKPVQSLLERKIQLHAVRYVDEIQVYDTEYDLEILLKRIMPDIRILGSDWEGKEYTGQSSSDSVYFHQRNHDWSTSELRERIKNGK